MHPFIVPCSLSKEEKRYYVVVAPTVMSRGRRNLIDSLTGFSAIHFCKEKGENRIGNT